MSCCSPKKKEEDHHHNHGSGCCSAPKKQNKEKDWDENESDSSSSCCATKQKEKKKKITRHMTIEEALSMFPYKAQKLSQEITNAGLHCIGCHAATWENFETGMIKHGKNNEDIERLMERLNALLEEEIDLNTITITPRGAAKFLEFTAEENKQGWGVRFSEEMAGCNGFEYVLDFAENPDQDDSTFISNGIEIYVKKSLVPRLIGSEIDYVDGLRGSGFKITNPNVNSSCGCGSSHGY